jgi:hypothetical protein
LLPYDLTQGGVPFLFHGHTDIKEFAVYIQDTIKKNNWTFNLGVRGDVYNGLAYQGQAEPRLGIAYNVKPTGTVLRVSYARTLETPFNENLIIGSTGCNNPFLATIVPPPGVTCNLGAINPGWRNDFHAGIEQAFGRWLVMDAEYMWKYTHNSFDFGIVGATPITFPIEWQRSKIPGYTFRFTVPNKHGFTAQLIICPRDSCCRKWRVCPSSLWETASSASTTTRFSIERSIFSTSCRGAVPRSVSIGAMTAGWCPALYPVPRPPPHASPQPRLPMAAGR